MDLEQILVLGLLITIGLSRGTDFLHCSDKTCLLNERADGITCEYPCSTALGNLSRAGEGSTCWRLNGSLQVYRCKDGLWTDTQTSLHQRTKRDTWQIECLILDCNRPTLRPTMPPVFTVCPANINVIAMKNQTTARVVWETPAAMHVEGYAVSITRITGLASGSLFSEGTTVIIYSARISRGQRANCVFTVSVNVTHCPKIPDILHGRSSCTGRVRNSYGSVCTHACDNGYQLRGNRITRCEERGSWDYEMPICEPVSCGFPVNVTGGSFVCPNGYVYQEICSLTCNPGFRSKGALVIQCREDGSWTSSLPCEDVEAPRFIDGCPSNNQFFIGPAELAKAVTWIDPAVTDNSLQNLTLTSNILKGSNLGPGFYIVTITATDSEGNNAKCSFVITVSVRQCAHLHSPANSSMTCSRFNFEGSICTVSCNQGFLLQGQDSFNCSQTGLWSSRLPSCAAVNCSLLPIVPHGHFDCSTGQQYQYVCLLVCNSGYKIQTPRHIQCRENGTWSAAGSCIDVQAPHFVSGCPNNIEVYAARQEQRAIAWWNAPDVVDNSGEQINVKCNSTSGTSFLVGTTYVTYTATDSSENYESCQFSISVTILTCGPPDLEMANRTKSLMTYSCPEGYVYGATCALNCTFEYPLVGQRFITCERDKKTNPPTMYWSPNSVEKPMCQAIKCPNLTTPANGALTYFRTNFGWDSIMTCSSSFDIPLYSNGHFYCTTSTGYWVPDKVPDCIGRVKPTNIWFHSDLLYYTSTCNIPLREINQTFFSRIYSISWKDACVNFTSCELQNIRVICAAMRKKRYVNILQHSLNHSASNHPMNVQRSLSKRASAFYLLVEFDVVIPSKENNKTAEETYQMYTTAINTIFSLLQMSVKRGDFNISNLELHGSGFAQPSIGADCQSGTAFQLGESTSYFSCRGCSSGYFLPPGSRTCQSCPVGTYSDVNNATSCKLCPSGMSTHTSSSRSLTDCREVCLAGSASHDGFIPCQKCLPGQFQFHSKATFCEACPASTWSFQAGASSIDKCIPADVTLVNKTLLVQINGLWSTLSVSIWLRLAENSRVNMSFSFGFSFLVYSNNTAPQISSSANSVELRGESWSRLVVVMEPLNARIRLYRNSLLILTSPWSPLNSSPTSYFVIDATYGKAIVSSLHAANKTLDQEEIITSHSDCTGNKSDNLLVWTISPSLLSSPSACHPIDYCITKPCGNHTCESRAGYFVCHCHNNWTGDICNIPQDPCNDSACLNGATCKPQTNSYSCLCASGYGGNFCEFKQVDGGWSDWYTWTTCNASCEQGTRQRHRDCTNPSPRNGGKTCTGVGMEEAICSEDQCVELEIWSSWGTWGDCSVTCGGGERSRTRQCINPHLNNGSTCSGSSVDRTACNTYVCLTSDGWSSWSEWSQCTTSCGGGFEVREHSCAHPPPTSGGDKCIGSLNESRRCNSQRCPECAPLVASEGTSLTCKTTNDPYIISCNVSCLMGYMSVDTFPLYTCGEKTGFVWNHQKEMRSTTRLTSCSYPRTALSFKLQKSVLMNTGCDAITARIIQREVTDNIPCPSYFSQGNCKVNVTTGCEVISGQKRNTEQLSVTVEITVSFGKMSILLENDTTTLDSYRELVRVTDDMAVLLSQDHAQEIFTIRSGTLLISPNMTLLATRTSVFCPPGTVTYSYFCVACAEGTKEVNGLCVECPLGQYQDETGSTSCKSCPEGLSWDLPRAWDISQCAFFITSVSPSTMFPFDETTSSNSTSISDEIRTGLISGLVTFGIVLIGVLIIFLLCRFGKRCWKKQRGPDQEDNIQLSANGITIVASEHISNYNIYVITCPESSKKTTCLGHTSDKNQSDDSAFPTTVNSLTPDGSQPDGSQPDGSQPDAPLACESRSIDSHQDSMTEVKALHESQLKCLSITKTENCLEIRDEVQINPSGPPTNKLNEFNPLENVPACHTSNVYSTFPVNRGPLPKKPASHFVS